MDWLIVAPWLIVCIPPALLLGWVLNKWIDGDDR